MHPIELNCLTANYDIMLSYYALLWVDGVNWGSVINHRSTASHPPTLIKLRRNKKNKATVHPQVRFLPVINAHCSLKLHSDSDFKSTLIWLCTALKAPWWHW